MKIKTNLNKNNVAIMLDDGFKIILTYNEFQELKKLIIECNAENEYNIKDIRHINKNKEYIAENNRMTKRIKENKCI